MKDKQKLKKLKSYIEQHLYDIGCSRDFVNKVRRKESPTAMKKILQKKFSTYQSRYIVNSLVKELE